MLKHERTLSNSEVNLVLNTTQRKRSRY